MLEKLSRSIGNKIGSIETKIKDTIKPITVSFNWLREELLPSDEEYIEDFREVFIYKYNDGNEKKEKSYRKKCIYPKNYDDIVKSGRIIEDISKDKEDYVLEYNGRQYHLRDISECEEEENKSSGRNGKRYFTIEDLLINPNFFTLNANTKNGNSQLYKPFGLKLQDTPKYLPVLQCEEKGGELCFSDCGINRNGKQLYKSWNKKERISFFEIRDHNGELHRWEIFKSLGSVTVVCTTTCAKMLANALTLLPIELGKQLMLTGQPILQICGKVLFGTGSLVKNSVNFISVLTRTVLIVPFTCDREKYADRYWTKLKYQWKRCTNEIKSDWNMVFSSEGINRNSEYINYGNDVKNAEAREDKLKDNLKDTGIQECKLMAIDSWDELNGRKNDKEDNGPEGSIEILKNQRSIGGKGHTNGQRRLDPLSASDQNRSTDQISNSLPPDYSGSPPSSPAPSCPGSFASSQSHGSNARLWSQDFGGESRENQTNESCRRYISDETQGKNRKRNNMI